MSEKFNPDRPFEKVRSMTGVRYIQDGHEYSSGHVLIGKIKEDGKTEHPDKTKADVRERARAKIAQTKAGKKGSLKGFRDDETPGAVSAASKENQAAKAAEEHAG